MYKRILSLVLTLALVFAIAPTSIAAETLTSSKTGEIDLSTDFEKTVFNEISKSTAKSSTTTFVPDKAVLKGVVEYNNSKITDYTLDGTRYIVEYLSDGTIRKTVKDVELQVIYVVTDNALQKGRISIKTINISDIPTEKSSRTDEEAQKLMMELQSGKISSVPVLNASKGTKTIDLLEHDEFNADHQITYGTVYSQALEDDGYYYYTTVKIYDTMDYFVESSSSTKFFSSGTMVTVLAVAFDIYIDSMISMITVAGVAVTAANLLDESVKIYDEHSYTYLGGKESVVYDRTEENAYVEVKAEWDGGKISLGWDYYSSQYCNPEWVHTNRSSALLLNDSTFKTDTMTIYNNNIDVYGSWIHGVGNLGY